MIRSIIKCIVLSLSTIRSLISSSAKAMMRCTIRASLDSTAGSTCHHTYPASCSLTSSKIVSRLTSAAPNRIPVTVSSHADCSTSIKNNNKYSKTTTKTNNLSSTTKRAIRHLPPRSGCWTRC